MIGFLLSGLRAAVHSPRLVLLTWAAPLLPALLVTVLARPTLVVLDSTPFAARVLDGGELAVLAELLASPANRLAPIAPAWLLLALALAVVQVLLASATAHVLLDGRPGASVLEGVRRNGASFARAAACIAPIVAAVLVAAVVVLQLFAGMAERRGDGRFDVVGLLVAAAVALALLVPLDLAYDFARVAAARHGDRSMLRGLVRALAAVLRRPRLLLLGLVLALAPAVIAALAMLVAPVPGGAAGILVLLAVQQVGFLLRATVKVAGWGAEIAAYRDLGEPRWCERRRAPAAVAAAASTAERPSPTAPEEPAPTTQEV